MPSRRLVIDLCIAAGVAVSVPSIANAQATPAPGGPPFTSKPVQTSPVTGDPSKELLLLAVSISPSGAVPLHVHPGDCIGAVLEGTVEMVVEGKEARRLSAGDAYANTRGTVHAFRNVGERPARLLNTLVIDKGAPPVQPVTTPSKP